MNQKARKDEMREKDHDDDRAMDEARPEALKIMPAVAVERSAEVMDSEYLQGVAVDHLDECQITSDDDRMGVSV